LAIYLDWLVVSSDETRSFFFPVTRLFRRNAEAVVVNTNSITPKLDTVKPISDHSSGVFINNISKTYDGCSSKALDNVSMSFQKGEIFGLLGFNGAGKSTLINILCGTISGSSGSLLVLGLDPVSERARVSKLIGMCAQNNILFDRLTVYEHLYHLGIIKNVSRGTIRDRISKIVAELELEPFLHLESSVLSGGQKRKLCIALAFISDPELVVLDEMSSGLDPDSRRVVWKFLKNNVSNKAILLCTHFMDEADLLCNRKAVLTQGQLLCIGSSEFIKRTYRTGYTLTIERNGIDDEQLIAWLLSNGAASVRLIKSSDQFADFFLDSDHLGTIKKMELELKLQYSIKENGISEIFQNAEALGIGTQDSRDKELLEYFGSFLGTNYLRKVRVLLDFELRRLSKNLGSVASQMILPILIVVAFWVLLKLNAYNDRAAEVITFNKELLNQYIPPGHIVETDLPELLSDKRYFVALGKGNTPGIVSVGTLVALSNRLWNLTEYHSHAALIIAVSLGDLKNVSTTVRNKSLRNDFRFDSLLSEGAAMYLYLILNGLLLLLLTDQISISQESVKLILITSGAPLSVYWICRFFINLLLTLPFNLLAFYAMKELETNGGLVYYVSHYFLVYMLQPVILSAVIGTFFNSRLSRGIAQIIFLGGIIIIPIIFAYTDEDNAFMVATILTWTPMYQILGHIASQFGKPVPNPLTATFIHLILYAVLLFVIENAYLLTKKIDSPGSSYVSFSQVTKKFGSKKAVDELTLATEKNEIFGLLGQNGCGKTTSLAMLTAQMAPTKGSIHFMDLHVSSQRYQAISNIGYCPQFDTFLSPGMTVESHLRLFCEMNGLTGADRDGYVNLILDALGIFPFKNVKTESLSGGTKRKVSSAMALMLPRSLLVLDEASTGLDPLARFQLWNTVRLLNQTRTTIMTTHYVEETSNCDRIGIMSKGKMLCCDTEHSLTQKFSKGYRLVLFLAKPPDNLHGFIIDNLASTEEVGISVLNVVAHVAELEMALLKVSLGTVVERLCQLKAKGIILDYSISRTTMEQLFLELVQDKEEATKPSRRPKIIMCKNFKLRRPRI